MDDEEDGGNDKLAGCFILGVGLGVIGSRG